MTKFSATFPILSAAKSSESRREKKAAPKPIGARFMLLKLERREPVLYFCLWGGSPIDNEDDPLIYGVSKLKELIMKLFHCLHLQQRKLA